MEINNLDFGKGFQHQPLTLLLLCCPREESMFLRLKQKHAIKIKNKFLFCVPTFAIEFSTTSCFLRKNKKELKSCIYDTFFVCLLVASYHAIINNLATAVLKITSHPCDSQVSRLACILKGIIFFYCCLF